MRKIKQFYYFYHISCGTFSWRLFCDCQHCFEKGTPQGKQLPAHHTKNGFHNIYDNTEHGLADYLR